MATAAKETLRKELSDVLQELSRREPLAVGPMFKQSKTFPSTFYKRHFVLYEGYLLYYPNEKSYVKDARLVSPSHVCLATQRDVIFSLSPFQPV